MNYDNIILIGNAGVGKSTLINAFLGDNRAETKFGIEGTTKKLSIYESDKIPFRMVDTVGFEPSTINIPFKKNKAIIAVEKWVKKQNEAGRRDSQINLIWFCIDGTSGRLFKETLNNFEKATRAWKSVPVIIVITKSYSEPDKEKNLEMINEALDKNKKLKERVKAIIPVIADIFYINDDSYAPTSGIDELLDKTNKLMPESRELAKKDFDEFKLESKKKRANLIVGAATTSAAIVAAVPIPIPDTGILTAIESFEILNIAKIYEIKDNEDSKIFIKQIISAGAVGAIAKGILSALKPLIGVGTVLNVIVATTIVGALGEVSITAFEQIYKGEKSIDDIDWIKKLLDNVDTNVIIEKIKGISNKLTESNPKEIAKIIYNEIFQNANQYNKK